MKLNAFQKTLIQKKKNRLFKNNKFKKAFRRDNPFIKKKILVKF